jgi:uncharacterized protein with FMN-binding domain
LIGSIDVIKYRAKRSIDIALYTMKKALISILFIFGFGGYVVYNNSTSNSQSTTVPNPMPVLSTVNATQSQTTNGSSAPPIDTTSTTQHSTAVTPTVSKPVTPKVSSGKYVDGTYTGIAADAYYGNIQVEAVISGGKLANVVFLQSPNDRSTSRYINQQAMPELKAEAIQAQSANVSGVSGASDSSAAFKESLASALSKAIA